MTKAASKPATSTAHLDPSKRHDVVFLIDVVQSNPNGDPDLQGQPRVNPNDGHGFITNVSLKRHMRDHAELLGADLPPEEARGYDLLIKAGTVLSQTTAQAYKEVGINVGSDVDFTEDEIRSILEGPVSLPDAFEMDSDSITYDGSMKGAQLTKLWVELKGAGLDEALIGRLKEVTTQRKVTANERTANERKVAPHLQERYYDARMFGFTSPGKSLSAGKLRGPVQVTNAVSLDPINIVAYAITRVARSKDDEKEGAQIGRTAVVDKASYRGYLFYSPHHANGVSSQDLAILWDALKNSYETTRSSARPFISVPLIAIFTHDRKYGNTNASALFDLLQIDSDGNGGCTYIKDGLTLPEGVTITIL
jgi:CRISPR-associated protein Csd2